MAEQQKKNMDWAGIALLFVGLGTLQYVLEEGNRNDWFESARDHSCWRSWRSSRSPRWSSASSARAVPAVDFSLFRDVVFISGTLIGAVMFAMLMAVTFLLPLFMQLMLGFTATQAGLAMMPRVADHDRGDADRRPDLQQGLAAHRHRLRHRALRCTRRG